MDRFFCPTVTAGAIVELESAEAHHLLHVLRHAIGDTVELFDGQGHAASAEIVRTSRSSVSLAVAAEFRTDQPVGAELVLGVAAPKGERLRWLVEKATELGVNELVPLQCQRSVADPGGGRLAKLDQTVISACKQCGRNTIMAIPSPCGLAEFASRYSAHTLLLADPSGLPVAQWLHGAIRTSGRIACAVGPEGGFSNEEQDAALSCGAVRVALGDNILRIETAAIAAAALIRLGAS